MLHKMALKTNVKAFLDWKWTFTSQNRWARILFLHNALEVALPRDLCISEEWPSADKDRSESKLAAS